MFAGIFSSYNISFILSSCLHISLRMMISEIGNFFTRIRFPYLTFILHLSVIHCTSFASLLSLFSCGNAGKFR